MFTVEALIARGARVRWYCDLQVHCGDLDLARVRDERGDDFTLVNRRPPCPVAGCVGRVRLIDHAMPYGRPLDTIHDRDAAYWAWHDRRREELIALGWRVEMGKWIRG